jgi:Ca2+-binding EF-hand superfamily protein
MSLKKNSRPLPAIDSSSHGISQEMVNFQSESINLLKETAVYRTEREMNVSSFREMLDIFNDNATEKGTMDMTNFVSSFKNTMELDVPEMESLFMKIDTDLNGIISWDDFSNYMLLRAEGEKTMREEEETQLFRLDQTKLHRLPLITLHKDHIGKIVYIPSYDNSF